jgi:predicted transcriptional regulator
MSDLELLAVLLQEREWTVREICERFRVSKPTALAWLARLTLDFGLKVEATRRRVGKRGPESKAYKVIP